MAGSNTDAQGQAVKPAKSDLMKFIIAGIILVIMMAGVSFGVATYTTKIISNNAGSDGGNNSAHGEQIGSTFDAGEFVTNLSSEVGNRFIKVKVVLAVQEKEVPEELELKSPQIKHVINSTLRQQTAEGLSQPRAMESLAELLKNNINALLAETRVISVYFTTFVIQ